MRYFVALIMILGIGYSQAVRSHAEHDKARFVANSGVDVGACNNRFRPCKTVTYAAQRANKGDTILVAQGQYHIKSEQDLLYFTGQVVPVLGGYDQIDQYQGQNPDIYLTSITGVPAHYAKKLSEQGFRVVRDSKSQTPLTLAAKGLGSSQVNAMQSSHSNVECVDGKADAFSCNKVALLGHLPLSEFAGAPSTASDIWGFVDLNTDKEYAVITLRNGVSVVDVTDPSAAQIVGAITDASSTWRDTKVYQYFDQDTLRWKAYAYVTTEANVGVTIVDLNDLENGISVVQKQNTDRTSHNIYISNLDYGLNISLANQQPLVHILGSDKSSGAYRSYSLTDPQNLQSTYALSSATANDYTHDASSVTIDDARAQTDCVHSNNGSCLVFLDFNETSMRIWDHSDPQQATELGVGEYPNTAFTHSGWWSEDKQFVFLHDEIDEQRFGLNTTVNIFDISSLTTPTLVGTWTGPTPAIDHNGFVRGNRYYMSNYERGLTILDITDPASPVEAGFFDTYPISDNAGFNGAWGVYPYLPSGNILVSDINSGLYILKDQSLENDVGQLSFSADKWMVQEGESVSITVNKTGPGATTVGYEMIPGSASSDDASLLTGELSWSNNDNQPKTIELTTQVDELDEITETLFVRLFDPRNGATLTQPNIVTVSLTDSLYQGKVVFTNNNITLKETDSSVQIPVSRQGGSDGAITVNYQLSAGSAQLDEDAMPASGSISWQDGDSSDKVIEINLIDDQLSESLETLALTLTANDSTLLGTQSSLLIEIRDDESNQAPTATAQQDVEVNTRQTVTLTGSASDPEQQPLSYEWQQSAGTNVTINNPNSEQMNFSAPTTAGELTFTFTATDDFGATSTDSVKVTVKAAPVQQTATSSGGSIGLLSLLGLMLLGIIRQKTVENCSKQVNKRYK